MEKHLIIVPGGLNTDIIGYGVEKIIGAGELTTGAEVKIGPGGKARNMAQMAGVYLGKGRVAMIGRSTKDPFGLWRVPVQSLIDAGVDTSQIKITDFEAGGGKFPGIAVIPVDKKGRNQIYLFSGANRDFCCRDIDAASHLFTNQDNKKIMLLALEIPFQTVVYAVRKAFDAGIRVIMDPGGISPASQIEGILDNKIFLLKPNEHEAKILTGMPVEDFRSAERAAKILIQKGVQNIMVTHGARGAYLFNREIRLHIPIPAVKESENPDETGCGDQVIAVIAALLAEGKDLVEACRMAVLAGTLQFHKVGIQPVTKQELRHYS